MKVSAPAPVPDLAGLAILLALTPDQAVKSPAFAPTLSPNAGAASGHSFQAALHDLLPGKGETEGKLNPPEQQKPEQHQQVNLATTVPVTVPVPPDPLPFRLALPAQYAVVPSQPAQQSVTQQSVTQQSVTQQSVIAVDEIGQQTLASAGPAPQAIPGAKTASPKPTQARASSIASARSLMPKNDSRAPGSAVEARLAAPTVAIAQPDHLNPPQPIQDAKTVTAGPSSASPAPGVELPASAAGQTDPMPVRDTRVVAAQADGPPLAEIAFTARLTPMPGKLPAAEAASAVASPMSATVAPAVAPTVAPTVPATPAQAAGAAISGFATPASPVTGHRIPVSPASGQPSSVAAKPADPAVPPAHDDTTPAVGGRSASSDRNADRRNPGESTSRPQKIEAAPAESVSPAEPAMNKPTTRFESSAAVPAAAAESHAGMPIRSASPQPPENAQRPDMSPVVPAPTVHAGEVKNISLRVADSGDHAVELKVTERAGEVHVSVRTQDSELGAPLRENLGDLVHKLEQSGFRAETWHPAQSASMDSSNQQGRPNSESSAGGQQQQQQAQQQGRGRDQQESRQWRWAQEMEDSLAPEPERNEIPWPAASTR